jgi:DNA-binding protein H-NS
MESFAELKSKLERVEAARAELQAAKDALAAAHEADRQSLVAEIRELLASRGYQVEEIVALLSPQPEPKAAKPAKDRRPAPRYAMAGDPSQTWSFRGKAPGWLAGAMAARGLDSADRADRDTFRREHMTAV